jgi:hypothetical protein
VVPQAEDQNVLAIFVAVDAIEGFGHPGQGSPTHKAHPSKVGDLLKFLVHTVAPLRNALQHLIDPGQHTFELGKAQAHDNTADERRHKIACKMAQEPEIDNQVLDDSCCGGQRAVSGPLNISRHRVQDHQSQRAAASGDRLSPPGAWLPASGRDDSEESDSWTNSTLLISISVASSIQITYLLSCDRQFTYSSASSCAARVVGCPFSRWIIHCNGPMPGF